MTAATQPPHSVEAEQAVLGSLLIDNDAWDAVADRITADDFYRRDHQLIFSAIAEFAQAGTAYDAITVAEHLDRAHKLVEGGGIEYISRLPLETATSSTIKTHAETVLEKRQLREAQAVGECLLAARTSDEVNAAAATLAALDRTDKTTTFEVSETSSALEVVRRIRIWAPRSEEDLLSVPELPQPVIRGLAQRGTVAIKPGEGGVSKTTLAMVMETAVASGGDFLGFDCEMPGTSVHLLAEDDQLRADYTLTRIMLAEIEQMKLEGWSESQIKDFVHDVRSRVRLVSVRGVGATLAVSDFGSLRISAAVDGLCKELSRIPDLRVLVIDTLSRFAGVPLDSNDSAPVLLTALERIAENTGAFVLALHHTGKAAAREKNEDQYSSRGASAITDNARLVLRLRPLDAEEVAEAGLVAGDDRSYMRLTVPKSNYFPKPDPITICRKAFYFAWPTRRAKTWPNSIAPICRP